MSKLLTALIAAGFCIGLNAAVAQNVNSDKDTAKGQDKENAAKLNSSSSQQGLSITDKKTSADAAQQGNAQSANTSDNCAKLSGKKKDKCIQATPAGAVDMSSGQGNKLKSEAARDRDRAKAETPSESAIPAQSNSSVGHPERQGTTGEGQNSPTPGKSGQSKKSEQTQSGKTMPGQSKDSVGHPQERSTTGEAQTLQESAPTSGNSSNQKSNK